MRTPRGYGRRITSVQASVGITLMTNRASPENYDVVDVERRAVEEILLHATAVHVGRSYPTLITGKRKLERIWAARREDESWLQGLGELVSEVFPEGLETVYAANDIETWAKNLLDSLGGRSLHLLRTYVALTEAYNYCANLSFLRRREWPSPWDHWQLYVSRSLCKCEEDVFRVCAAFSHSQILEFRPEVFGDEPVPIKNTVRRLAVYTETEMANLRDLVSAGRLDLLVSKIADDVGVYLLRSKHVRLASALRLYLVSGKLMLKRSWKGYTLPSL